MAFGFSDFCTLLSGLESIELHDPPLLPADKKHRLREATECWFRSHRSKINDLDAVGAIALLSSLLPERRTDRVYGIQNTSLCRILNRCLGLSASRTKDLQRFKAPGNGDMAACLERVLKAGGPPALPQVTLVEVDNVFLMLAGQSRFSDPTIRLLPGSSDSRDQTLANIFKRLKPVDAKWFVRLILKDFSPVRLGEYLVLKLFHFLLPDLLRFQDSFDVAIALLKGSLHEYPECPDPRSEKLFRKNVAQNLRPTVNTKVGRPNFQKARSIDHCLNMLGKSKWVLERKYDGEYCEVHIDLAAGLDRCIKIFSKSGKDSTADRRGLHETLHKCLRLGHPNCSIRRQAILLGELVVWSDESNDIVGFEKIRKHVSRSGVFLGTEADSQAHAHEHLMIVFFDILLLDDECLIQRPVEERRIWLRETYTKIHGRANSAEWKEVDFSQPRAKRHLVQQFAASIATRCEGLVLKPCGVPYFSLNSTPGDYTNCFIKLKKDYIANMGDEADFAVIGASYVAQEASKSGLKGIKWTHFHLGCLVNGDSVRRFSIRPIFRVVATIAQDQCIPKPILQTMNTLGYLMAKPYSSSAQPADFDIQLHLVHPEMDVTFAQPFVVEVLGSSFERPPNTGCFMLRHPRIKKLLEDRSWKDCVSFQELQQQAKEALEKPVSGESQEMLKWMEKLEGSCRKKFERRQTTTPRSSAKMTPGSAASVSSMVSRSSAQKHKSATVRRESTGMPSSTSDMDGSLLVATTASPRKHARDETHLNYDETPVPATKRQRSRPLADVTNRPPQRLVVEVPIVQQKVLPKWSDSFWEGTRDVAVSANCVLNISDSRHSALHASKSRQATVSLQALLTDPLRHHHGCLFSRAVVYLAPCIAGTLYITQDLLPLHGATMTSDLGHWDRNIHAHPSLTDIVCESQAYVSLRKIALVESKRQQAVKDMVKQVLRLNSGKCKERIEVFDWRALEESCSGARGGMLQRHFLGATMFDEVSARTIFASGRAWLNQ